MNTKKIAWNKGLTKEDPRVASYANNRRGFKHTEEAKRIMSLRKIGTHRSEETKLKIGAASKGNKYRLGTKGSERQKEIARLTHSGDKNVNWKGDKVSYSALHHWINRKLGKALYCSNNKEHIALRYHWGNISGDYRRDTEDWQSLCPSCNMNDGVKIPKRLYEGRRSTWRQ